MKCRVVPPLTLVQTKQKNVPIITLALADTDTDIAEITRNGSGRSFGSTRTVQDSSVCMIIVSIFIPIATTTKRGLDRHYHHKKEPAFPHSQQQVAKCSRLFSLEQ